MKKNSNHSQFRHSVAMVRVDPAGKGSGILGFGFGPGTPFCGGSGFGPAMYVHYDHSIWQAGPGTISLGGVAK